MSSPLRKTKNTVEPVFGSIKAVMGFRQFLLRGEESGQKRVESGLYSLEPETVACLKSIKPSGKALLASN